MAVQHVRSEPDAGGADGAEAGGEAVLLADRAVGSTHWSFLVFKRVFDAPLPSPWPVRRDASLQDSGENPKRVTIVESHASKKSVGTQLLGSHVVHSGISNDASQGGYPVLIVQQEMMGYRLLSFVRRILGHEIWATRPDGEYFDRPG